LAAVPIVQFLKKSNDNPKSSGCHGTQTKTPQPQVGRPLASGSSTATPDDKRGLVLSG
jgi:hypothetical protein